MNKFNKLFDNFLDLAKNIDPGIRNIPLGLDSYQKIDVTEKKLNTSIQNIVRQKKDLSKYVDTFNNNFNNLNRSLILCSSPQSFITAWRLRSKELSLNDAEKIINDGGQIIPSTQRTNFNLLKPAEQGVVYNDGVAKDLIHAVRHNEGNYDDDLDDLGIFKYQPPANVSGMLKYRWCQFISRTLNVDYIVIVAMWFQYKYFKEWTQGFILAPAKIIGINDDLENINESLHHPLKMQIITREEAYSACFKLTSLGFDTFDIPVRNDLNDRKALEWGYDKLNTVGVNSKGKKIKKWAQINGKKCPDGRICNNVKFSDLKMSDIAFGHIVSQKWCNAFGFLRSKVHHPDNLYLTCKKCNSSLSDNFPDNKLQKAINKEEGTIGDWIRNNEDEINKL
tara:strand:- start:167 stop:1345 length:1179 start_codon:yes stop_codon:yes gene_type:complete